MLLNHNLDYNMTQLKYHWLRDTPDARDHLFNATITSTPTTVDLRANCSTIEDQGNLGSCTGNAIAGIVEYLCRRAKKNTDVSRLFIYYQERVYENSVNQDNGAYIRDGIKAMNKIGVPTESLWPYNINKFAYRPSQAAYVNAATRKAVGYQKCVDFTAVKNALAQGYPVVVGFDVYASFESDAVAHTGQMPYPNKATEELLGGHCVALVGYNDVTSKFIARNSWGTGWGDHGYFYMPYQVIQDTTMSDDFWIITSITNP
jgi:C1A family cysteine protease